MIFKNQEKWKFRVCLILLAGWLLPVAAVAQSDNSETPLGDIARALRKNKQKPAEHGVIDNDNFSKVMDQAEAQHVKGNVKFSFEGSGKDVQVLSPDVTCSLSFSAGGTQELQSAGTQDLPSTEVAKLDGPAAISGDTLEVSVYNGTDWKISEITVGLTIVRPADSKAAIYSGARLIPAAGTSAEPSVEKRSDMTVLYHLKGAAGPFTSAVFRQSLGVTLGPDQEWHWAIVQARGTPTK
jgi:hypothetical protein